MLTMRGSLRVLGALGDTAIKENHLKRRSLYVFDLTGVLHIVVGQASSVSFVTVFEPPCSN